jgi:1-acyl-sn-glycerol-3-phosphate acyltransferase
VTKVSTKLAGQSVPDKIAYHTVRTIVTVFCRVWCRMSIEGRDNIPTSGPFILAPTHRSIIDTPVASGVYRRRMRFMGADKWWSNKHFGNLLSALGGFPVSRGSADREALKRCIAVIEGGEPLVLFPEGERKSGPVVQPLVRRGGLRRDAHGCRHRAGGHRRVRAGDAKGHEVHLPAQALRHRRPAAASARSCITQGATGRDPALLTAELHAELQRLFDLT